MGAAAVIAGDQVIGFCAIHQVPSPSGAPMPSPAPLPFAAPLTEGLATRVLVGGQPVAVVGCAGTNTPPHVGLHASDPFMVPTMQRGQVIVGSTTVLAQGQPMAYTGCSVTQCGQLPANVIGSGVRVLVGP
ncbi:PAAR domain-containing protein [Frankia sp. Cas3]|uniref:PAAR domain-containing protein n=1 Tax=Frankia sp. Cas3 TaxID=3073926 RepID=UPI002AD2EDC4|nr:PAAR domain-containing protein [Frankia sp. Cas3]